MNATEMHAQSELWALVNETLWWKPKDASPAACLNRLTNERLSGAKVALGPGTAVVREERWLTYELSRLERKHSKAHDFDDNRPIVVVEFDGRLILVDGNHRVTRWIASGHNVERQLLIIRPTDRV